MEIRSFTCSFPLAADQVSKHLKTFYGIAPHQKPTVILQVHNHRDIPNTYTVVDTKDSFCIQIL